MPEETKPAPVELNTEAVPVHVARFAPAGQGDLRLRSLQPEQLAALRERLAAAGIDSPEKANLQTHLDLVAHTVQICLVGAKKGSLLFKGADGLRSVKGLPQLLEKFKAVCKHTGVFE